MERSAQTPTPPKRSRSGFRPRKAMASLQVPAELRLIDFCDDAATKAFCSELGLRKQLSILIGKRIDDKVKDRETGVERPRFSVELALVSRVFLARSIQTSISEDG